MNNLIQIVGQAEKSRLVNELCNKNTLVVGIDEQFMHSWIKSGIKIANVSSNKDRASILELLDTITNTSLNLSRFIFYSNMDKKQAGFWYNIINQYLHCHEDLNITIIFCWKGNNTL